MTEERTADAEQSVLLQNERSLLDQLLSGEVDAPESYPVEIVRNGKPYLRFRIRPLSEHEYEQCEDEAATTERNRQAGGAKVRTDFNAALYRSLIIYTATTEEGRAEFWENEDVQRKYLTGVKELIKRKRAANVVERLLRAGEKAAVIELIDRVSGYGTDLTETLKN